MNLLGIRKFLLGLVYVVGGMGTINFALMRDADAGVIAAVAAAVVSLSPGVMSIVWGNVKEHEARNGN